MAFLGRTEEEARAARLALSGARGRRALVVSATVYAELVAALGSGTEAVGSPGLRPDQGGLDAI